MQVTEIAVFEVGSVVARLAPVTEPKAKVAVALMVQLAVMVMETLNVPVAVPAWAAGAANRAQTSAAAPARPHSTWRRRGRFWAAMGRIGVAAAECVVGPENACGAETRLRLRHEEIRFPEQLPGCDLSRTSGLLTAS